MIGVVYKKDRSINHDSNIYGNKRFLAIIKITKGVFLLIYVVLLDSKVSYLPL